MNNNDADLTTVQPIIIDPLILPSKPNILIALYAYKTFFIKWLLTSNGGSDLSQITISILRYGITGPQNSYSLSNKIRLFN